MVVPRVVSYLILAANNFGYSVSEILKKYRLLLRPLFAEIGRRREPWRVPIRFQCYTLLQTRANVVLALLPAHAVGSNEGEGFCRRTF